MVKYNKNLDKLRSDRAKKAQETGKKPKANDVLYFIPVHSIDALLVYVAPQQTTTVGSMDGEQFRVWFLSLVNGALNQTNPSGGKAHEAEPRSKLIRVKLECEAEQEMDKYARFYLLNELYKIKAFRDSGIPLLVEPGQEEQAS